MTSRRGLRAVARGGLALGGLAFGGLAFASGGWTAVAMAQQGQAQQNQAQQDQAQQGQAQQDQAADAPLLVVLVVDDGVESGLRGLRARTTRALRALPGVRVVSGDGLGEVLGTCGTDAEACAAALAPTAAAPRGGERVVFLRAWWERGPCVRVGDTRRMSRQLMVGRYEPGTPDGPGGSVPWSRAQAVAGLLRLVSELRGGAELRDAER